MNKVEYRIVEHDGGWAYTLDGVYSETFAHRHDAVTAARRAAVEKSECLESNDSMNRTPERSLAASPAALATESLVLLPSRSGDPSPPPSPPGLDSEEACRGCT